LTIAFVLSHHLEERYRDKSASVTCWITGLVPFGVVLVADNVEEVALLETELLIACGYVSLDCFNNLIATTSASPLNISQID
jgi:hypothetical protein